MRIGALYRIEAEIRGQPPDERRRIPQAQAVPLLDDMRRRLECTLQTLSGKSDTSKAIQYSLERSGALTYTAAMGLRK
jgi:transposase